MKYKKHSVMCLISCKNFRAHHNWFFLQICDFKKKGTHLYAWRTACNRQVIQDLKLSWGGDSKWSCIGGFSKDVNQNGKTLSVRTSSSRRSWSFHLVTLEVKPTKSLEVNRSFSLSYMTKIDSSNIQRLQSTFTMPS